MNFRSKFVLYFASSIIEPRLAHSFQDPVPLPQAPLVQHALQPDLKTEEHQAKALAHDCTGYGFPQVICIHRYGSLIQGDFERRVRNVLGDSDTYPSTEAPDEPSMQYLSLADFLVYDHDVGPQILGPSPAVDFMFEVERVSHEGPVYSPSTNELYITRIKQGFLPQLVVDLSADPPKLQERLASPPIYCPTGARYHNDLIYYSTIGGNASLDGHSFRPGIYTLDPRTGESRALVNNYYGYYFNAADDLDIDDDGQIWFTDNDYGRPCHVNTYAPQMKSGTWRFNESSGMVTMVEDSLSEPNGATLSPDKSILYLTDTGAGSAIIDGRVDPVPKINVNMTGPRVIYAYDIHPSRKYLTNKRLVHLAMDYAPDGIKISREGYIVTATGHGVIVLTAEGEPLVRVQTNFTVINVAWAGKNSEELWAVGIGGIARIRWDLRGPVVD